MKSSPFWAITSFYNPAGYARRIQNYRAFRRNLGVPLLVVELAESGGYRLDCDDADIVLRVSGNDRIWQKERLLNIALDVLPEEAEFVAWIDCDVVFGDTDWPVVAESMLRAGKSFVQLFDTAVHLSPQVNPDLVSRVMCRGEKPFFTEQSFVSALASGSYFSDDRRATRTEMEKGTAAPKLQPISHGIAWAGHRELLRKTGLYDACVIGGGDVAVALGVSGNAKKLTARRPMTEMHEHHYLAWARAFEGNSWDDIGSIAGSLYHLWHGRMERRRYKARHGILRQLGFNPDDHLEVAENGTWLWAQHAIGLRSSVDAYFFGRLEDQE